MMEVSIHSRDLQVLRILCQGVDGVDFRPQVSSQLARYRFRAPVHQLLFETLLGLPIADADGLRRLLAARMTNQGFPDFDLESLFAPHGLHVAEAEALLRDLSSDTSGSGG